MLVEFSVGNFWSFKEIQTLQMQAAKIVSKFPRVDEENVFPVSNKLSLLKCKAIYGANASGKSNLVKAMASMWHIVRDNIRNDKALEQFIIPFKLNEETVQQPSFFQLIFVHEGIQYRYGFEASRTEITSEWLWGKPLNETGVRERYYFIREGKQVEINEEWFKEGSAFVKTGGHGTPYFRDNSLFLTVVAAFNGALSSKLVRAMVNDIFIVSDLEDGDDVYLMNKSISYMAENESFKKSLSELMGSVDPSIRSIEVLDMDNVALTDFPEADDLLQHARSIGHPIKDIAIYRSLYDKTGKETGRIPLILNIQESEGTKRIFRLSYLIFTVLDRGNVLFIDEFDAKMHPRLTKKIVQVFNSPKSNPNNSQLVFVTHDSTLLDARLLRRDQIVFARKDKFGATELVSLAEFKGVRNDASFEKDYLAGKYGAVPNNLNIMESIFETSITHAKED